MPRQAATIGSLPQAFEGVKEMQADGPERGEGCRPLGRQAPAGIIEGRDHRGPDGRGSGPPARHPRRRHFCPTEVSKGSARRAPEIDRAIPAGVVPGLSTRKVGEVLLALPGRPVPAATPSTAPAARAPRRRGGSVRSRLT